MPSLPPRVRNSRLALFGLALLILLLPGWSAAAAKVRITKAAWAAKKGLLTVKGQCPGTMPNMPVEVYDSSGRLLATGTSNKKHKFLFQIAADRPELLCSVRVKAAGLSATRKVALAPKNCAKAPQCQILSPTGELQVQANTDVGFSASAMLKDKDPAAQPLRMEWDFAGGSMGEAIAGTNPTAYKRPDGENTTVQFVRDNSQYRVRFTAWDKKNRYCEDSVMVTVGSLPAGLPDVSALVKQAQDGAPQTGSQMAGNPGDVVVLPFPNLTYQNNTDARYTPDLYSVTPLGPLNGIEAIAYRKDRLPLQLTGQDVQLKYSAASNPNDPVAPESINSTSQNWPLNSDISKPAPLIDATIQKSDLWDHVIRPATEIAASGYFSTDRLARVTSYKTPTPTDEGITIGKPFGTAANFFWGGDPPWAYATPTLVADDHGRYMPGRDAPFSTNAAQDFTAYLDDRRTFIARNIPITDIDDAGRVNPYPLMRVQAADKASGQTLASADSPMSASKDLHCRECHAKGKIAANDKFDWASIRQAYHSTWEYPTCTGGRPFCSDDFRPPSFIDPVDRNGQPSQNLFDQEYAALWNASNLHDWYDGMYLTDTMNGSYFVSKGLHTQDRPDTCTQCHQTLLQAELGAQDVNNGYGENYGDEDYWPRESPAVHRFHAELQLDPSDSSRILRGSDGRPLRWDPAKGSNPNTLFPTVDAQGASLPQEQSCLRCHAGHREPLYRDRMYSAGVTCYDCHGDMLAVGQAYKKAKPGPEGFATRMEWYEQPDCGSCHTGDANRGQDGQNGFHSAGVMKRAFDASDRSATPRTPPSQRFAVQPSKPIDVYYTTWIDYFATHGKRSSILSLSSPLYRNSKDTHGDVACAACHGGAHEIWPNRDPKANDNVTATQLQGHAGHILECNVCHTSDAFKNEMDLDGGRFSGAPKSGILGGPHNLHPVNDLNWWKSAIGDSPNTDGTAYGGWHNNYAKMPGKDNEDQCAACHGNDHKGTRLSKTPVDRVFDFSGFNMAKLKKAGFKSKIIKVPAGTEIGCNTCHSIQTSCIGSPAGSQCGTASDFVPSTPNHDPVITSTPAATTAVIGQPYSYQVAATDADGDPLSFSLGLKPGSMTISDQGLVTTDWPMVTFGGYRQPPLTFPYTVTVTDGKGGYAAQTITMTLRCPDGQHWEYGDFPGGNGPGGHDHGPTGRGACVANTGVLITSQPVMGVTEGNTYVYQVVASSDKGLPLTYSIKSPLGAPPYNLKVADYNIDPKTGLVTAKTAKEKTSPQFVKTLFYTIRAEDGQGGSATQTVVAVVCRLPKTWHNDVGKCM